MKKICNVIILILVIIAIIISIKIVSRFIENSANENIKNDFLSKTVEKIDNNTDELYIEYEGYKVEGIIEINKINLKYPILTVNNEESMRKSITKFWGDKLNEVGNVTLAGHNNFDGTMFGKIKDIELEDEIEIIDLTNRKVKYKVFDKYITDPNDVNIVNCVQKDVKEITLVTCTNGNKNRLIIKAREF